MKKSDIVTKVHEPGLWEDANGDLHMDLSTLLKRYGLPDTQHNRAGLEAAARRKGWGKPKIVERGRVVVMRRSKTEKRGWF